MLGIFWHILYITVRKSNICLLCLKHFGPQLTKVCVTLIQMVNCASWTYLKNDNCWQFCGNMKIALWNGKTKSRRVHYHHVSAHVKLLIPYTGINCLNADDLEERVQGKLLDLGWPQHRRMFTKAGAGTCKGPATGWTTMPFPYYTGVLVCDQSMEDIGIRLATKKDHAKRKR